MVKTLQYVGYLEQMQLTRCMVVQKQVHVHFGGGKHDIWVSDHHRSISLDPLRDMKQVWTQPNKDPHYCNWLQVLFFVGANWMRTITLCTVVFETGMHFPKSLYWAVNMLSWVYSVLNGLPYLELNSTSIFNGQATFEN